MTLFDTSVIIDARDPASPWHRWAQERIAEAVSADGAGVNVVVLSEASVRAENPEQVADSLEAIGIKLLPLPVSAATPAAKAFGVYLEKLRKDGKERTNKIPLPDFLIGAHAESEGLKLVTRDPDRVRTYFPKVELVVP
jgi:predicted nucleic acid-binding protein